MMREFFFVFLCTRMSYYRNIYSCALFFFSHVFDCVCVWVWVLYCCYSNYRSHTLILTYHCSDFMNIGGKVQPLNKQPPHLTVSPVLLSLKDIPHAFFSYLKPRKFLTLPFFYPYHVYNNIKA